MGVDVLFGYLVTANSLKTLDLQDSSVKEAARPDGLGPR